VSAANATRSTQNRVPQAADRQRPHGERRQGRRRPAHEASLAPGVTLRSLEMDKRDD